MDLLGYWRFDNYVRDLQEGAGFHWNSRDRRLHSAIEAGESLWLVTRVRTAGRDPEYRMVARLVVRAKTINPPGFTYGEFRVWGDLGRSEYYRVDDNPAHDAYELLRGLPLHSGTLGRFGRARLAQALQRLRALSREAAEQLSEFCRDLPREPRAHAVADEVLLEEAFAKGPDALEALLRRTDLAYSPRRRRVLRASYSRNRRLASDLTERYEGRCQVCGFDSRTVYGVDTAHAHHLVYLSRGGRDEPQNLVLLCPNHHTVIHRTQAVFDYARLSFVFPNGRVEPLCINTHLARR